MMKRAWRKRLLEEWRGVPEEPMTKETAQPIGDLLPGVMKKLGLTERYAEEEMARAWTQIVGHPLCVQAVPVGLRRRVLHVRIVQPTIHYVIEGMREEILAGLKQRFGTRVANIRFVRG